MISLNISTFSMVYSILRIGYSYNLRLGSVYYIWKSTIPSRFALSFSWPHMAKDVNSVFRQWQTCQQNKPLTQKPFGLLQPLPIPSQVWEDISMYFITHLPPTSGKSVIWVFVDRLSKYAHFVALPTHVTAVNLAPIFISEQACSKPLSVIEIRYLLDDWGANYPDCMKPSMLSVAHTTPSQIGRLRSPTAFWKHTSFAMLVTHRSNGCVIWP